MFKRFANVIVKKSCKRNFKENEDIKKEQLLEYVKSGSTIIDVRSPQEFREGHIDGAINIPDYEIRKKAEAILTNKEETIVVYCSTGQRSKKVQERLKKMGYINIYNVYEGIIIEQ